MTLPIGLRAVLIDLDGTLVDTATDIAAAINGMLMELGRPATSEAQVRAWIGNGARRLVMRAMTGRREGDPGESVTDAALGRFFEHYAQHLAERSRPYPGVVEALAGLSTAGLALGVVTNKPERFTDALLAAVGLLDYFGATVSGDTLPVKKPHPAPLRLAAERLGVPIAHCVMVGDSMADLLAARNCGIPMVCVSYGYRDGDAIFSCRPDAVVDRLDELVAMMQLDTEVVEVRDHP